MVTKVKTKAAKNNAQSFDENRYYFNIYSLAEMYNQESQEIKPDYTAN